MKSVMKGITNSISVANGVVGAAGTGTIGILIPTPIFVLTIWSPILRSSAVV